jgi:hypothetical protein
MYEQGDSGTRGPDLSPVAPDLPTDPAAGEIDQGQRAGAVEEGPVAQGHRPCPEVPGVQAPAFGSGPSVQRTDGAWTSAEKEARSVAEDEVGLAAIGDRGGPKLSAVAKAEGADGAGRRSSSGEKGDVFV